MGEMIGDEDKENKENKEKSKNNNNLKINDHSEQVTKLKELYDKSDLNNFEELDMYIELFIAEKDIKNNVDNFNDDITDRELVFEFDKPKKSKKNNINSIEIQINNDEVKKSDTNNNNNNDIILISPIQTKFNSHNTKMNIEEINNYISEDIIIDPNSANIDKFALKKYKPNPSLPMIILSVSANLNSFQFLMLINQTFKKFN